MKSVPTYHDCISQLTALLAAQGCLGLITIDLSPLAAIEDRYGSQAYESVLERVCGVLSEHQGTDILPQDILTLEQPRSLRFVLFVDRRRKDSPLTPESMKSFRTHLADTLSPKLARAAIPYLTKLPRIDLGQAIAIHNPLIDPYRVIGRAVREALDLGTLVSRLHSIRTLESLQQLILTESVETVYQPIVRIRDRAVLGFEALSRGGPGSGFHTADRLFGAAASHNLLTEVDRLCRRKALLNSNRIPKNARIFVNTLPATIRDPEFKGQHLIALMDEAKVTPDRLVLEITEKLVIENYSLFREAMAYFTDLGMSLAIDDVGAGYSGLETIGRLMPAYLKVDIGLVHDVHASVVNREMLKAIVSLAGGIGARVIAEGIQNKEELAELESMAVDFGQGFYLGRPEVRFHSDPTERFIMSSSS